MSTATMLEELRKLPREEQVEFLDQANEMVFEADDDEGEGPDGSDLPPDLKQLLDERIASYEADPTRVVTWEQIVERCRNSMKK